MDKAAWLEIAKSPEVARLSEKTLLENLASAATIAACLISVIGIWFVWLQLRALKKQMADDHDRSRRELAVELTRQWALGMRLEMNAARRFFEDCTEEQCRKLSNFQPFEIREPDRRAELLECLRYSLREVTEEQVFDKGVIHKSYVVHLRQLVVSYLNLLESILMARRHSVADRDLLKEEFRYLVKPDKNHYVLKYVRAAMAGSYPAIDEFVAEIDPVQPNPGKEQVDKTQH